MFENLYIYISIYQKEWFEMQKTQTLDKLILENFKASHHFKMNSNNNYFIHNPMEIYKTKKENPAKSTAWKINCYWWYRMKMKRILKIVKSQAPMLYLYFSTNIIYKQIFCCFRWYHTAYVSVTSQSLLKNILSFKMLNSCLPKKCPVYFSPNSKG